MVKKIIFSLDSIILEIILMIVIILYTRYY